MCLRRLNYDRKELERKREESQSEIKGWWPVVKLKVNDWSLDPVWIHPVCTVVPQKCIGLTGINTPV